MPVQLFLNTIVFVFYGMLYFMLSVLLLSYPVDCLADYSMG